MSKLQHPYFPPCLKLGSVFAFPPLSKESVWSAWWYLLMAWRLYWDIHGTSEDVPSASVGLKTSSLPTCHSLIYTVLPDAHKSVFLQKTQQMHIHCVQFLPHKGNVIFATSGTEPRPQLT